MKGAHTVLSAASISAIQQLFIYSYFFFTNGGMGMVVNVGVERVVVVGQVLVLQQLLHPGV
jgi:hypothetical protein